ncbi:MAG: hypothetical protein SFV18_20865 [Bryobacteraceae bacterium]|nr:hypothetical protein [Bryobacteraceae bacterium]
MKPLLSIAFFAQLLHAGTEAFTATKRISEYEVMEDGSERLRAVIEGDYLRSSDGSEITYFKYSYGSGMSSATLVDAKTKKVYALIPGRKLAEVKQILTRIPRSTVYPGVGELRGTMEVNGVMCQAYETQRSTGSAKWCDLPQQDIRLRSEYFIRIANSGSRIRIVEEVKDLRLGVQPPAEKIAIPADYRVEDLPAARSR